MKGSISVFVAVFKNWFRSKSGVFFSFMFPLMLLLIFGTVFGGTSDQSFSLHVQNRDIENGQPTELSTALENALESTGVFQIHHIPAEKNIDKFLDENPSFSSRRILVIPEGFQDNALSKNLYVQTEITITTLKDLSKKLENQLSENQIEEIKAGEEAIGYWQSFIDPENASVILMTSKGDTNTPTIRSIVSSIINDFNNRMIGSKPAIQTKSDNLDQRDLGAVDYYLPGFIAAFIMSNGLMGVTSNTSEFRRNGVIKRLASTPLGKGSWILGNLLHQALLAFMLTLVMIGTAWIIFGVTAVPGPLAIGLIFTGSVLFCSMGMSLGGTIKDIEAASAAGSAIGFPMMFLSGAFWPLEMMPSFMETVAKALPLYYFHDGLRKIMIYSSPREAIISTAVIVTLAVIFVLLSVRTTKWKEF